MRTLRRRPERQTAVGLARYRDDSCRLHRHRRDALVDDAHRDDHVGVVEDPLDRTGSHPVGDVRTLRFEHDGRVGLDCRLGVDDDGQRVVVDDDRFGRVDRLTFRLGDDNRDDVAHEPDAIARQRRTVHRGRQHHEAVVFGQVEIVGGVDRDHAGHRDRVARVDALDHRVRDGRPHERDVGQAGDLQVVEVFGDTGEDARVFSTADRITQNRTRRGHACASAYSPDSWRPIGGADYRALLIPPRVRPMEHTMDGIAGVQARIQDIITQFNGPPAAATDPSSPSGASGSSGSSSTDFASALAQAQSPTASSSASVPASSGTLNRAGVDAVQWAKDFLTQIGAPITASNVQAITAWEQAEGTKAAYNPLATTQGGFAGETQFNSVGVKNYVSYQDGLAANVKVINNGLYPNILAALQQGNDAMAVAQAIASSPWGTGKGVERVLMSQSGS